ncbi:MAG: DNA replication/repair protein RecF [Legionella sp.]|nr:DNA replication/repair protein RecF [Legionella sp.]
MILTELNIHNVRNISNLKIQLNKKFNFFIGPNGSGKTSILEALSLLSCGHSFRSREIAPIITHNETMMTVHARGLHDDSISIQKSHKQATQIKLNNQFCFKTSELAYTIPSQILYSDIFQIIDAGSAIRRGLLDWGLFHVKHEYLSLLKNYKKILKQRNALLRTQAPYQQFIPWDLQLSHFAIELDRLREAYFVIWQDSFKDVLIQLTDVRCAMSYYKGWDKKKLGKGLCDILEESFASDKTKLYTQHGPHQADILIESNETKAKHYLSRGQQKIILTALKCSQASLLEKQCLYLIDDIASELDDFHQDKLITYLESLPGQYVITSTQPLKVFKRIESIHSAVFHLEHGAIYPI